MLLQVSINIVVEQEILVIGSGILFQLRLSGYSATITRYCKQEEPVASTFFFSFFFFFFFALFIENQLSKLAGS